MSKSDICNLDNKVAIVAGGSGLIGGAISKALALAGAYVLIGEENSGRADETVQAICDAGGQARAVTLDVTSEDSIKAMIHQALEKNPQIDICVHAAYPRTTDWGEPFENVKSESWRKNIEMQLNSSFYLAQSILEVMKKQKSGVLVNLGSTYGMLGPNFSVYEGTTMTMPAAYSAIKGGVINFTRYLATYYGKYNVRVNAVCPGGVFDSQDEKFVEHYEQLTPLNRMATPEDIAAPVAFLCSDGASYITGQAIMVDGGWSAW